MTTTGVNFGIPVLVSQIDWSYNPSAGTQAKRLPKGAKPELNVERSELLKTVHDRLDHANELLTGTANILDFRPDVQLATSTAVALSARFPFVTPPGTIVKNKQIAVNQGGVFQSINELQLTDGGLYDNTGGVVARDIIADLHRSLDRDERLKPFKDVISFHLIRFVDTPAKRQALASENAQPELVAPFAALNAVRLSRGVSLAGAKVSTTSYIYLLDDWYEGTLNWLLTKATRENIDQRSSWLTGAQNILCCQVRYKSNRQWVRIPLKAEEVEELKRLDSNLETKPFIANKDEFDEIFKVLREGGRLPSSPAGAAPVATPSPATPPPVGPALLQVTPAPEK